MSTSTETILPELTAWELALDRAIIGEWSGNGDFLAQPSIPAELLAHLPNPPRSGEAVDTAIAEIVSAVRTAELRPFRFGPPALTVDVLDIEHGWQLATRYIAYCEAVCGYGGTWMWGDVKYKAKTAGGRKRQDAPSAVYIRDGERVAVVCAIWRGAEEAR